MVVNLPPRPGVATQEVVTWIGTFGQGTFGSDYFGGRPIRGLAAPGGSAFVSAVPSAALVGQAIAEDVSWSGTFDQGTFDSGYFDGLPVIGLAAPSGSAVGY